VLTNDDDDDHVYEVGEARVISQSLSALTAPGSSDGGVAVSAAPSTTSPGGSTELVPVRDVVPSAGDETGARSEGRLGERQAPHHGSMTFIVDFGSGAGGRVGSSGSKNPAAPLSECLPPRLRRKSVQHRAERDDRDEDKDHDAEVDWRHDHTVDSRPCRPISRTAKDTKQPSNLDL